MSAWLINPPSSGTLAFSLRLAPSLPAADFPAFHTGYSASPPLAYSPFPGASSAIPPPYHLLRRSSDAPPTLLRRSSNAPPTLLRRSSDAPPTLLRRCSDALASSLRLMPTVPATNALSPRSGSSAPSPTTPPSRGPISSNCPPRPDLHYVHLQ